MEAVYKHFCSLFTQPTGSGRNKSQKLVGHFLKMDPLLKCTVNLTDQNGFWPNVENCSENGQWPAVISSTEQVNKNHYGQKKF